MKMPNLLNLEFEHEANILHEKLSGNHLNEIALAHPGRFKVIASNIDREVSIGSIEKDQIDR